MKQLTFISIILAFSLCSCMPEFSKQEHKPPLNIIVAVDLSGSIPEETTEWYRKMISETLLPNLGWDGKIVILPIDAGSVTASREIYTVDFGLINFHKRADNPLQQEKLANMRYEKTQKNERNRFITDFNNLRTSRSQYGQYTDILGSLSQAKHHLSPTHRNFIIIFSDMLHETPEFNLLNKIQENSDIETLLNQARPIPLGDTRILIATGEQPTIPPKIWNATKVFWEAWCKRQNIKLENYTSASEVVISSIFKKK